MNEDYGIKEEYDKLYKKLAQNILHAIECDCEECKEKWIKTEQRIYNGQTDQEDKINREESVEADRQASQDGQETRQEDCRLWNEKDEEQVINRYNMVALTIIIICIIFCLVNALFN